MLEFKMFGIEKYLHTSIYITYIYVCGQNIQYQMAILVENSQGCPFRSRKLLCFTEEFNSVTVSKPMSYRKRQQ